MCSLYLSVFSGLSAPALRHHHPLVLVIESDHAVIVIKERYGLQLSGHAAGTRCSLRTLLTQQTLHDGVFGGRDLGGQGRVAHAVALVGLVAQGLDDPRVPANVFKIHKERGPLARLALNIATDSGGRVVDKVGLQLQERLLVQVVLVRTSCVVIDVPPESLLAPARVFRQVILVFNHLSELLFILFVVPALIIGEHNHHCVLFSLRAPVDIDLDQGFALLCDLLCGPFLLWSCDMNLQSVSRTPRLPPERYHMSQVKRHPLVISDMNMLCHQFLQILHLHHFFFLPPSAFFPHLSGPDNALVYGVNGHLAVKARMWCVGPPDHGEQAKLGYGYVLVVGHGEVERQGKYPHTPGR